MGLDYSFVNKNKHVKKNIATSMENVAEAVDKDLDKEQREDFHELLRVYRIFFQKTYSFQQITHTTT